MVCADEEHSPGEAMTDTEAHDLTYAILKQIQADLAELKQAR